MNCTSQKVQAGYIISALAGVVLNENTGNGYCAELLKIVAAWYLLDCARYIQYIDNNIQIR